MQAARPSRKREWLRALLVLPAVCWLLIFTVVPIFMLVVISLWTPTAFGIKQDWTIANYHSVFTEPVYVSVLFRTLRIAILTTLLSLATAYPMALYLSRVHKFKTLIMLFVFLPFWTSYVVRGFMWLPMLGRNGLLNFLLINTGFIDRPIDWFLYNEGAIYVGLVYAYMLFMFLPIYQSLDRLDPKLIEAASDLGATPLQAFRHVIFPLSLPGVASGCTMVFLFACGAYVTPQLLGGASNLMIGNVIASQFQVANNWALGAALAITLMALVLTCFTMAARRLGLLQIFLGARS
jgi:spermidine/putrescine transport system permease protein